MENICTISSFTSTERNSLSMLIKANIFFTTTESSDSQTWSSRYPNQGIDYVLLPSMKNFHISGRKFVLQWSLIIQNNMASRYPSKNRILPLGIIYPQFGKHWLKVKTLSPHTM